VRSQKDYIKKNKDEIKLKKEEGGNKYFSVSIVTR
jgi:hypothetical protein